MLQKFKRFLSLTLCALLVVAMLPQVQLWATAAAIQGTCGDNVSWSLEDGTLTISGSGSMSYYSSYSSTPWYEYRSQITHVVVQNGVTRIGNYAFYDCSSLTSITIGDSVTSIGDSAFEDCSSLTSVTIPDSVNWIDWDAFKGCDSLKSVYITDIVAWCQISFSYYTANPLSNYANLYLNGTLVTNLNIPDSVTSIGDSAFTDCSSLTSVTIPDSVTSIGERAFSGCTNLTSVTIPDSVTSVGYSAFHWCQSLTSVYITDIVAWCQIAFYDSANPLTYSGNLYLNGTLVTNLIIPDSVTNIGDEAFHGCSSLTSITLPDSVTGIGDNAFYNCTNLTSITIPDSVTSIGDEAFYYCTNLTSITIPDSVTSIGGGAFSKCSSLTSITIPDSVTSIGGGAFSGCTGLTSITIPDSVTSIGYDMFLGCSSLISITIPDSVTSIGNYAFNGCGSLTSIIIPESVTSIGNGAFCECSSLTSITIPESVTSIGDYAFDRCSSLTSITIPDGVTSIGYDVFWGCSSLTSITIPDSVTSIGWYAFYGCSSLKSVYITDMAAWCQIGFESSSANPLSNGAGLYLNGILVTNLIIPDSVTSIGDYAFYNCSSLTGITIGDSVTSIGGYAFMGCSSLTSITIPESVTSIGRDAFSECSSLTGIALPDSVTSIGNGAFSECSSLTSITLPDSLTSIGNSAFYECSSLTSITIPESVTSIDNWAFADCSSLTSITIPDNVTSIGDYAFYDCSSLKSVYITDMDAWCQISFGGYDGANPLSNGASLYLNGILVTNLIIPESVTSIGGYAFMGCSSLTSVTIPDGVGIIGDFAFSYCSSLTSIIIPESVTSIGGSAFSRCSSLAGITIPESVTSIGDYAFCDCSSLTSITLPASVTSIDNSAFMGCSSLTSITLPDDVTSIGWRAFYDCSSLTSITLPDGVTSIDESAFYNCSSLTSITFLGAAPSLGSDSFEYVYATAYYPCSDTTWTSSVKTNYGGTLTWEALHTLGDDTITKDATCVEDAIATGTCLHCGITVTTPISGTALGHSYGENGLCIRCGQGPEIIISMKDSYGDGWNGAAIEVYANGELVDTATISSGDTNEATIPFYPSKTYIFKWVSGSYDSECSFTIATNGEELFSGTDYSDGKVFFTMGAVCNHQYEVVITPPTCTEDGYTTSTCTKCGDSYAEDDTPATGHSYESEVVAPTCTVDEHTLYTCSVCGDTATDSIPGTALGHSYEENGLCIRCGNGPEIIISMKDSYGDGWNEAAIEVYANDEFVDTATISSGDTNEMVIPYTPGKTYTFQWVSGSYDDECSFTITMDGEVLYTCSGAPDSQIFYTMENVCIHQYEIVITPPSCTEEGFTSKTCTKCGASEVTDTIPATGHNYVDGACSACGAKDPDQVLPVTAPTVAMKFPSLSFEDVIIMNVYYTATDLQDVVEMGLITYTTKPTEPSVETADHVVPGYDWSEGDQMYYSSTAGIAPKDLGDTIYFGVYWKLTDGTYGYTKVIGYSPKTYAVNMLKTGTTEMKTLVAAMLNYGAAAQNYFGYNTDTLVNADMTDEQKALAAAYSNDMIAAVTQASGDKLGTLINDKTYSARYTTITFEGAFCINYYFKPTQAVEGDVTMYVWSLEDFNANDVLSKENATKAIKMTLTDSGEYTGVIDGIAAKDLDKAVYVSFVYNDGTTEHCGGVLGYTIGMYCKTQASKTGTLAELAEACAVYGYYAKQLFN